MESESAVPHIQIFWQFEEYYKTLLFTPMSITPLIGMEDARIVLNVSRPSPKAILNGEIRYCLQVTCKQ